MSSGFAASHLLIFEPDPRGHTFEWLECLLHFASGERAGRRVTFVVAPELAKNLTAVSGEGLPPHIGIVALSVPECESCLSGSLVVSGFARWWLMRRYLKRTGADHGLFLCLDHLSLPLALGLHPGRGVSGILFRPSTHYRRIGDNVPNKKERVRDFRKRVLYALMLRNPALKHVLSLDPYFAEERTGIAGTDKVAALADPAFPPRPESRRRYEDAPPERLFFLLFGALTARKGILALLDALMHLHPLVADRCAIMIAGKVDPELQTAVTDRMANLAGGQPSLWIEIRDRHIHVDELDTLLRRSDVVLAPYQRFVGSSGVMLRAAGAGKPLITQDYGLLGRLARDHALGCTTDTTDPRCLADAITSIVHNGTGEKFDPARAFAFATARSPSNFAATLLDEIVWEKMQVESHGSGGVAAPRTGHASSLP